MALDLGWGWAFKCPPRTLHRVETPGTIECSSEKHVPFGHQLQREKPQVAETALADPLWPHSRAPYVEIVPMAEQLVREFSALDEVGSSRIRVRVVSTSAKTRRGIRLDADALSALIAAAKAIHEALIADPARPARNAVARSRSVGLGKRHH